VVADNPVRSSEPTVPVPDAGVVVTPTPVDPLADALGDRETLSVMRALKIQTQTKSTAYRLCGQRPLERGAAVVSESMPLDVRQAGDMSRPISSLVHRGARSLKWGEGRDHFGGPADSMSPVALRRPLAGALPFRLALRTQYGRVPEPSQPKCPEWKPILRPQTRPPPSGNHRITEGRSARDLSAQQTHEWISRASVESTRVRRTAEPVPDQKSTGASCELGIQLLRHVDRPLPGADAA
jgi:hypothetical protein